MRIFHNRDKACTYKCPLCTHVDINLTGQIGEFSSLRSAFYVRGVLTTVKNRLISANALIKKTKINNFTVI